MSLSRELNVAVDLGNVYTDVHGDQFDLSIGELGRQPLPGTLKGVEFDLLAILAENWNGKASSSAFSSLQRGGL